MLTLSELAERTGYSRDQLKRRLARLGAQLNGDVRRGAHGKLLVSERVVEVLSKLKKLEDQGLGLSEALRELRLAPQGAQEDVVSAQERTAAPKNTISIPIVLLWAVVGLLGILAVEGALIAIALWR
jgi:hypothetical protein